MDKKTVNKKQEKQNKQNKASTDTKFKLCEVMQYTDYLSEEKIIEALESHKNCISRYAYILHDKDVYTENDKNIPKGMKVGDLKKAHYHVVIQFKSDDGRYGKHIATWFGVQPQYVQKCTAKYKGKNGELKGFKGMCYYLVHANCEDKYQYPVEVVKSNFDYKKFIETGNMASDFRLEQIIQDIDEGKIKEYNIDKFVSIEEYDKYRKSIQNAFDYKRNQQAGKTTRDMSVIYISGTSGSGKTLYAKSIAERKGYSLFVSGSGDDFLDGYAGQECIILDDFRGSDFKFSSMLKLLDNNCNTSVKSRYHNKDISECKLLIITCVYDIDEFYSKVFSEEDEPILQFKRRCGIYLKMTDSQIQIYQYDKNKKNHVYMETCDNPRQELLAKMKESKFIEKDELVNLLGLKPIEREENPEQIIVPF